jgi:hypothetical protein
LRKQLPAKKEVRILRYNKGKKVMNKKEQRMAITRAFREKLVETQGKEFSFMEDDVMLIFDFIKGGLVYKGLEYHRGMNEVFNPVSRWADGHGDNTKHFAYEAICDMLNDELEEIRAKVEEQAMFEKINKGLGIAK